MKTPEEQFEHELKIFGNEIETNLKMLFAYLSIKKMAGRNKDILEIINYTPRFWTTTSYALQCSYFITLGRIFDQESPHNIDRVLKIAQENFSIFSKKSLAERKRRGSVNADEWLDDYMKDVYEPTIQDFRRLRKLVTKYRQMYGQGYKDIRRKFFAHKEKTDDEPFPQTNIKSWKLSMSLLKLHDELWQLFVNGRKPAFSQESLKESYRTVQEIIINDTKKLLINLKKLKGQFL